MSFETTNFYGFVPLLTPEHVAFIVEQDSLTDEEVQNIRDEVIKNKQEQSHNGQVSR